MPTAAFATLGCKVNQYETQRILNSFEARGFAITEHNLPADVYVLNSCSVTQAAERKSRYMLRKMARQNPKAVLVMTGCYGEMAQTRGEAVEDAHMVVPNPVKLDTLRLLLEEHPELDPGVLPAHAPVHAKLGHRTRGTLKVQDGCNVYCAFCSIPYTRKIMVSVPAIQVLAEAETLVAAGHRELVVTGVLVGAYGPETGSGGPRLPELLTQLAGVSGSSRVRLSSIEPTQVSPQLVKAFAQEKSLCNHLHIPLQSGSTRVLELMNRPYTQQQYLSLCDNLYKQLPHLAVTTDIMVGFPGESRADFDATLQVVRTVGFARAHIFRFSPRTGTPGEHMTFQVSEEEKEDRSRELAEACSAAQRCYIARYIGKTLPVLVEGADRPGGLLSGYTENYIRVVFPGGSHLRGTVTPVTLCEPTQDGAAGEAAGAYQPEADVIPITLVAGTML